MTKMNLFLLKLVLFICLLAQVCAIEHNELEVKSREARTLWKGPWFPYNSAIALAIVLVLPLNFRERNVYLSYNIETNYYLPYFDQNQGLVPLPYATIFEEGTIDGSYLQNNEERKLTDEQLSNNGTKFDTPNEKSTKKEEDQRKMREERPLLSSLISRKKFYKILVSKLNQNGFNGTGCLLRTICETNEMPLGEHNGVVGDIFHILFTPSSSRAEKLPNVYYEAEHDGETRGCQSYEEFCSNGIFNLISKIIEH